MEKRLTDKTFFLQILAKYYQKAKQGIIDDLKQSQQDEKQSDRVERALG